MKKTFSFLLFLVLSSNFFALNIFKKIPINSQKLVPAGHWVYDAINDIFLDVGKVSFSTQSAPLSVAELKTYMEEIDYQTLSKYGKAQYNQVFSYFENETVMLASGLISMGGNIIVTPELYYRNNEEIQKQDRYFFKDNFLSLPIFFSAADNIYIESDFSFGKNYWAAQSIDNYFNMPINFNGKSSAWDAADFDWPRTVYLSAGVPIMDKSVLNFKLGRASQSIGNTQTGSIIFSQNFETDFFSQVSFFSPDIKYTLDVTQVNVNEYMYSHRIQFRFFKKLQISFLENAYIVAPFELRYLNPFMVLHSFAFWNDYVSSYEFSGAQTCAFIGYNIDFTPIKNLRIYALFAQNEFLAPSETDNSFPNSLGAQLGIETIFPMHDFGGSFRGGIESVYTLPWLYIKHTPENSLASIKYQETTFGSNTLVTSWIGTPFGPDTLAVSLKAGYEMPSKWSAYFGYQFLAQGSNAFADNVFTKNGKKKNTVSNYPATTKEDSEANWITAFHGPNPAQFTNRFSAEGTYNFTENISAAAKTSYVIVFNNKNIEDNTHHGIEMSVSFSVRVF